MTDAYTGIPVLTRTQARNQATEIGKFPRRHTDGFEGDIAELRPEQREPKSAIAARIREGDLTILKGRMGTGKTWLACLFGFKWYERGYSRERGKARYWTLTGLLQEQKSWYGLDNSKRGEEPMCLARKCGLLFIDELVAQSDSLHDQTLIRDLLDERYREKRATVIITNLDSEGLLGALDTPTLDRAREHDGRMVIQIKGSSQRGGQH